MNSITFIDTEIEPKSKKILSIGGVKSSGGLFHSGSLAYFVHFLKDSSFIGGHNIIRHDLVYLQKPLANAGINLTPIIDSLYLSPLLFPKKPYHALVKDDKLHSE